MPPGVNTSLSSQLGSLKWDREKNPHGIAIGTLPKSDSATDPFSWSEDENVAMLSKGTAGKPWGFCVDPKKNWGPCDRFVVGPDLVREWKAKHGKK